MLSPSRSFSAVAVALVAFLPNLAASVVLTAQPFLLNGQSVVSSAKLTWSHDTAAASYQIQRSIGSNAFTKVAVVPGNSFDDYGLPAGNITYQITSLDASGASTGSVSNGFDVLSGQSSPASYSTFSNLQASSTGPSQSRIKLNGVYYRYNYQSGNYGFSSYVEQTSSDGYSFSGGRVVLTSDQVCAGSDTGGCKMERVGFVQHPVTNEVVMWGHWENNVSYSLARVVVAFGMPGGTFTFGGSFRPEGQDSRDMDFFVDSDQSGYIISATNVNRDMAIYSMTPDWHNITAKLTTVLLDQHREAPSMIVVDGTYYLFTSTAAGWYPSSGQYISSTAVAGPWSDSQNIGDLATFAAQSGGVGQFGGEYAMLADRWASHWKYPEASSRSIMLPIAFTPGRADMHFYPTVQFSALDVPGNLLGVQTGKILSTNRPVTASAATSPYFAALGNDGISLVAGNYYAPTTVPFTYMVTLASPSTITQLDLSTRLVGGSETYYTYTVDCINGGKTSQLVDMTTNTVVGFTTSQISSAALCLSVRINVSKVTNVQNGNSANWAAGIVEFVVYGNSAGSTQSTTTTSSSSTTTTTSSALTTTTTITTSTAATTTTTNVATTTTTALTTTTTTTTTAPTTTTTAVLTTTTTMAPTTTSAAVSTTTTAPTTTSAAVSTTTTAPTTTTTSMASTTTSIAGPSLTAACYTDPFATTSRTLGDFPRLVSSSMTPSMCQQYCSQYSATLYGVEWGTECYCGNSIEGGAVPAPASDCSYACGGDSTAMCGGSSRINVYGQLPGVVSASTTSSTQTTTTAGPSVTAVADGCYTDPFATTSRTLGDFPRLVSSSMTPLMCQQYCSQYNAVLFGVEWGTECYCGNSIEGGAVPAPASDCSYTCAGDSTAMCGGSSRINIYGKLPGISATTTSSTQTTTSAVPSVTAVADGCYTDPFATTSRTLGDFPRLVSSSMTPLMCQQYCSQYNAALFGVEWGVECYCGNSIEGGAVPAPASDCSYACGGDSTAMCGGSSRINIYGKMS